MKEEFFSLKLFDKNPLYFAFLFPALVDAVITIIGQGGSYWSQPNLATDASPAYYFLTTSPWLFILGSLVWFVVWYWLFLRMSESVKYFFVFLFVIGHSWGSSTWIIKILKNQAWYASGNQFSSMAIWSVLIAYFVVTALLATLFFRRHLKNVK